MRLVYALGMATPSFVRILRLSSAWVAGSAWTALAACSQTPPPADTPAGETEVESSTEKGMAESVGNDAPARKPFHEMSPGERMTHMKTVIIPEMKPVFSEFEPNGEFTCKTCHGSRAAQGNFAMPNPDILPLDPSDGFADEMKDHPGAVEFMKTKVVPKMAELMGESPYDPAVGKGFGCFECHTMAKAE